MKIFVNKNNYLFFRNRIFYRFVFFIRWLWSQNKPVSIKFYRMVFHFKCNDISLCFKIHELFKCLQSRHEGGKIYLLDRRNNLLYSIWIDCLVFYSSTNTTCWSFKRNRYYFCFIDRQFIFKRKINSSKNNFYIFNFFRRDIVKIVLRT